MKVTIDFNNIRDMNSFHDEFALKMGFPDFYGKNLSAWIDCMSYIDDKDSGMSTVIVSKNESLDILLKNINFTETSSMNLLQNLIECISVVNERFIDSKSDTRIKIVAI